MSTALASGLAALVFHMVRLGAIYTSLAAAAEAGTNGYGDRGLVAQGVVSVEDFNDTGSRVRSVEYMREAFRAMELNEENRKYVEVWRLFDDKFGDANGRWKDFDQRERMGAMAKLASFLVFQREGR